MRTTDDNTMNFTTPLVSASCKTPLSFVPSALITPHQVIAIQQVRGLLTLVGLQPSSPQTLGTAGIRGDSCRVNGPEISAASFSGDTSALSVWLQGRRSQGQIYPEGQCVFLHAEPPPPLLPAWFPFPAFGGAWRALRAGSCRWVQKQDSAGGSWKEDESVKCTQRRLGIHSMSLQRAMC